MFAFVSLSPPPTYTPIRTPRANHDLVQVMPYLYRTRLAPYHFRLSFYHAWKLRRKVHMFASWNRSLIYLRLYARFLVVLFTRIGAYCDLIIDLEFLQIK